MNAARDHVDTVLGTVRQGAHLLGHRADDSVFRSWQRCFDQYGLDPSSQVHLRVESGGRLRRRREQHEPFLRTARAGMEALHGHLAELGYVLMLADADGITLDAIGRADADSPLRDGLVIGADWNEMHAGTNGIGTCIAERGVFTCHRQDHYYAGNLDLSCTAAPLHDPHGEFIGVLDVSALMAPESRDSQHFARHLTGLYARMIEDANFIRHFRDRWILQLSHNPALIEVSAAAMLAVDGDGIVVGANSGARRELRLLDGSLHGSPVGHSLAACFRTPLADAWRLLRSEDGGAFETWDGTRFHGTGRAPRRAPVVERNAAPVAVNAAALGAIGDDDAQIAQLVSQAQRLAARPINIVIHGETGTGKEVLARALHAASPRADRAFVAINCAAIPESLIESELFGYTPGTFTGARSRGMVGLIQRADGGTLFLDEIGDMPLDLQTRLLRVLSEGEVLPLGADKPIPLRLTVVAASHRDLRERVADGAFRQDLFYRLGGATLQLPPLRERADRGWLIHRLLREEAAALGAGGGIAPQAFELLMAYAWPGNIRELRNVLRFALTMADDADIAVVHLPAEVREGAVEQVAVGTAALPAPDDAPPLAADEANRLLAALRRHHWNISEVARELSLCRATVYRRMRRHGIVVPTQYS